MRKRLRPLLTRIALSCSVTRLGCFFLAKKIPILHAISQSANRESNLRFTHLSRYVALTIVDRSIAQYSVNPRGVPDCQEAAILVVRQSISRRRRRLQFSKRAPPTSRHSRGMAAMLFDCKFVLKIVINLTFRGCFIRKNM